MRFDKSKDPGAVAPSAKDAGRYSVAGVAVVTRGGQTFLAATDGRALTFVRGYPDDGEQPSGVYPSAAFAAARKAAKRKADATVALNGAACVDADGTRTEFAKVDATFPDVTGVVPAGEPVHVVRLNAEFLARIQRALGANGVEVRVHGDGLPLTILPIYADGPGVPDGSLGVLMPIGGDS